MSRIYRILCAFTAITGLSVTIGADWRQFRGPGGQGISSEKNVPTEWSADKNITWKVTLPGAGASCPVTLGDRVFVTCYSGYGMDVKEPGMMEELRRHLLCLDRASGQTKWSKEFEPQLPEHKYQGEGAYHGYAPSTPLVDDEHLYVFFGKSGVFCFDLDGHEVWHVSVGKNTNGWGSGPSPILYKDSLIVNASVESGAVVALNKKDGKELWRSPGIGSAWNTPVLVTTEDQKVELVVSINNWVVGLDPENGKELWRAEGVHRYVCPSVVAHDGIVYAIGGGSTSLAVKAGARTLVRQSITRGISTGQAMAAARCSARMRRPAR
jgi:outer membrane protein assembly factor BamB